MAIDHRNDEWFFDWDVSKELKTFVKLLKFHDDPRFAATDKNAILEHRKDIGRIATARLFDSLNVSPMFLDSRVLMLYTGAGAANRESLPEEEEDQKEKMTTVLQFLCMYPDIPSSSVLLFLRLGREFFAGSRMFMNDLQSGFADPTVIGGNSAAHLAVLSADMIPTYSQDEYVVETAVEKSRILFEQGADFDDIENNKGWTPRDIAEMLAGTWDEEEQDPHGDVRMLIVRPRHVTARLAASDILKMLDKNKCIENEPESSVKGVFTYVRDGAWRDFSIFLNSKQEATIKETKWMLATDNSDRLPLLWYFLRRMQWFCEREPLLQAYVPISEFYALLDFYLKNHHNQEEVKKDLENIYWFCAGAAVRYSNALDKKGVALNPFEGEFLSKTSKELSEESPVESEVDLALKREDDAQQQMNEQDKKRWQSIELDRRFLPGNVNQQIKELETYGWTFASNPRHFYDLEDPSEIFDALAEMVAILIHSKADGDVNEYAHQMIQGLPGNVIANFYVFVKGLTREKWERRIMNDRVWKRLGVGKREDFAKTVTDSVVDAIKKTDDKTLTIGTQDLMWQNDDLIILEAIGDDKGGANEPPPKKEELSPAASSSFGTGSGPSRSTELNILPSRDINLSKMREYYDRFSRIAGIPGGITTNDFTGLSNQDLLDLQLYVRRTAAQTRSTPPAAKIVHNAAGTELEKRSITPLARIDSRLIGAKPGFEETLDPSRAHMHTFFAAVLHWPSWTKVLRHYYTASSTGYIASRIHSAVERADIYSLHAIRQTTGRSLDVRHPTTGLSPVQTAINVGHSPQKVAALYGIIKL